MITEYSCFYILINNSIIISFTQRVHVEFAGGERHRYKKTSWAKLDEERFTRAQIVKFRSLLVSLREERMTGMDHVSRCRQVLLASSKLAPPLGGYLEPHALAGVAAVTSAEDAKREAELMKRLAARRKETGLEVNVTSTYCGQRISFDPATTVSEHITYALNF